MFQQEAFVNNVINVLFKTNVVKLTLGINLKLVPQVKDQREIKKLQQLESLVEENVNIDAVIVV